jgi:hypothetical protein
MTQRGLSASFLSDLKNDGKLSPFLLRVHNDPTLDLKIRNNYVNIYYRGGSMFRIKATRPNQYEVSFNKKYIAKDGFLNLPNKLITNVNDAERWIECAAQLKDTMDLWFGKHPKEERALQQLVAWENNSSPWANSTDYFVIDIEYDNHKGARFDLVAFKWPKASRRLPKGYKPRLVIIEMKAGDGAIGGSASIGVHIEKTKSFLQSTDQVVSFKEEMIRVFNQKRELGLIKALRKNTHNIAQVDDQIDFMFLFAGHNPSSTKLGDSLKSVDDTYCRIQVCVANFMGFGLYRERVYPLNEFKMMFPE